MNWAKTSTLLIFGREFIQTVFSVRAMEQNHSNIVNEIQFLEQNMSNKKKQVIIRHSRSINKVEREDGSLMWQW